VGAARALGESRQRMLGTNWRRRPRYPGSERCGRAAGGSRQLAEQIWRLVLRVARMSQRVARMRAPDNKLRDMRAADVTRSSRMSLRLSGQPRLAPPSVAPCTSWRINCRDSNRSNTVPKRFLLGKLAPKLDDLFAQTPLILGQPAIDWCGRRLDIGVFGRGEMGN